MRVGAFRKAVTVAQGGMLLPLASGFATGWYFLPSSDYKLAQLLFIATALSISAVPVSIRILMDLGKLKTPTETWLPQHFAAVLRGFQSSGKTCAQTKGMGWLIKNL